jgi:cobalt-zinc-cadmium efflux system protein
MLAVLAVIFAAKPATTQRTQGYYRLETLAAVVNALLLFGVAVLVLIEAWQRWKQPPEVQGGLMLVFATVGLVANIAGLLVLRAGSKESLNVKGAYLEVLGDLLVVSGSSRGVRRLMTQRWQV